MDKRDKFYGRRNEKDFKNQKNSGCSPNK